MYGIQLWRSLRVPLALQGAYFALTGAWALVHLKSFMAVTGEKTDTWLVKTVGALVVAIGGTLMLASLRRRPGSEIAMLASLSGLGLAAIDTYYSARGRIRAVYLLDAVAEIGFATWVVGTWNRTRRA
jgi:hypothetical protein